MGLQLYRRHRAGCEAGHSEESRTGKFEEGRRNWKKCRCQIFASGTLGGKFKRKCTDKWEWDKAEAVAADWQNAARALAGKQPTVHRGHLNETDSRDGFLGAASMALIT